MYSLRSFFCALNSFCGKEFTCHAGDSGSILGSGRSPGERNGNPLQYSCLENPTEWSLRSYSLSSVQFSSVAQSCPTLRSHESQHTRPPCPSPSPGVHSDSCPSSQWCHPAISPSVIPFSSCPQSLPASESFPVSQLFACGHLMQRATVYWVAKELDTTFSN